jgi:hypothetical protein
MIFNFTKKKISQKMLEKGIPKNTRHTIIGMISSNSIPGEKSAALFLQKNQLVRIDWNFCCNCGNCFPEPLVSFKENIKQ